MFVGSLNQKARDYLVKVGGYAFRNHTVVIGCSGSFTLEAIASTFTPLAIHANDVSLASCAIGNYYIGQDLPLLIVEDEFLWLNRYMEEGGSAKVAALLVFQSMLAYEKRNNAHRLRLWDAYEKRFDALTRATAQKIEETGVLLDSFYPGDVFDFFQQHAGDDNVVFLAYPPTYTGGYEQMYKRMSQIIQWDAPAYNLLTAEKRNDLFSFVQQHKYLWWDDRVLEGQEPVMVVEASRNKTVFLYSNHVHKPGLFRKIDSGDFPNIPIADWDIEIKPDSTIDVVQMKPIDLLPVKEAYLGKNVRHTSATWAFRIVVDGGAVGFIEIANRVRMGGLDHAVYLQADFCIPHTCYKRLSKLIIMVATCGDMRRKVERLDQLRKKQILTTVFTDKPVSMKYRGVFDKLSTGTDKTGAKYINYLAQFNDLSFSDVLKVWLEKHGKEKK